MFERYGVTYALMKIGIEAGYPEFGVYLPPWVKQMAIKQAKENKRGWGKWQIAMLIISTTRLLAKNGKMVDKKLSDQNVDMATMIALDKLYKVALKKLDERNLGHDCVVTRL